MSEQMKPITGLLDAGYDDIVSFGRVLSQTIFYGEGDEAVEMLLSYFEGPHKWEAEYQKWRELGGSFSDPCLRQFEDWYDSRAMAITD
jgi:hypothetical protein